MADYFSDSDEEEYTCVTEYVKRGSHIVLESSNGVSVLPLSLEGSLVATALANFKSDVGSRAPYFMEGKATVFPALNITISKEEKKQVLFQLPYDNVEEIYTLAEQSQVGTATKTLFRLDARRSKECSNVEVLNQEWKDAVSSICDQIRQVLAPGATKVTASLYKLLIYREEDFFKLHQDVQLTDRMFATLLFFLPIHHLGGEFSIEDPEEFRNTTIIGKPPTHCPGKDDTIANRGTECSWVAFYTDVRHQVSKVTKGYRVALNYTLSFEGAMYPHYHLSSFNPSISRVITKYLLTHSKSVIAIPLMYEYTLSTLSPEYLKGYDTHLYNALSEISVLQLQFIVRFEKTKVVDWYRYDDGDIDGPDNQQLFQGIFTINSDMAKQFFDIRNEEERLLEEVDQHHQESGSDDDRALWKKHDDIRSKCNDKYFKLMKIVKKSQKASQVEWIVNRDDFLGNPKSPKTNLCFNYGHLSWLGNWCPHKEYYYLSAAIVVAMAKESK